MSGPLKLLTLRSPAPQFDPAKGPEGLPQRILVMPWGDSTTTEGQVIVNETTLKTLSAFNAARNWDRIALDFEHSSVPGSPTYKGEPVKVAGYGTLDLVSGEGIYLLMSSWTAEGKEYAAGGHYGDLSPVVQVNKDNEVIGLHSAALCRHGATPGLIFLSASIPNPTPKKPMDPKKPETADELFAALKTLLGLGADAQPADILSGISSRMKAAAPDEDTKVLSAIQLLSTKIDAQDATIKLLSATHETSERGTILATAAREGKVVPAMAKDLNIAQLKQLCAELPVTVPMAQRGVDIHTLMLSSGASLATPEMAALDERMGVSADDRKKFLGHA